MVFDSGGLSVLIPNNWAECSLSWSPHALSEYCTRNPRWKDGGGVKRKGISIGNRTQASPLKSAPGYVTLRHFQLITRGNFITNGQYLSIWSDQRIPDRTMLCLACPLGIREGILSLWESLKTGILFKGETDTYPELNSEIGKQWGLRV